MKKDPKDKEIARLQKELAKANDKIDKLKQEKSELRADNRKKKELLETISPEQWRRISDILKGILRDTSSH